MDEEQYLLTHYQLRVVRGLLLEMDLIGFLSAIDLAHATGPILDPTLYREAAGKLEGVEQVAKILRWAQVELGKLIPDAEEV
jgi:hypothetical protein